MATPESVTVLGISGSLRAGSHNRKILRAAAELLPPGARLVTFDRLGDIPPYNEDDDAGTTGQQPEAVREFKNAIAEADRVLIATPEYNGSIPGQLKNALDWASRPRAEDPLRGKRVAVVGSTNGLFGAVWAQAELRKILGIHGAEVLDRELGLPLAMDAFDEEGNLVEDGFRDALRDLLEDLAASPVPA